ncbi:MAG: hypothetical protein JXA10_04920 [Anaerolineae bacterium]|nr:hypothetical protein [Anaerolineae bacterium]
MSLAYLVNRIPGQPIIVARLTDQFTLNHNAALYRQFAELAAEIKGDYYRIIDFAAANLSVSDSVQSLKASATELPGSASDPRVVKNFYTGLADDYVKTLHSLLEQLPPFPFTMIVADSLEQALNAIYAEMENSDDAGGDS